MIIPPSEWNPKIRIEPPEKYLSKVYIKKQKNLSYYNDLNVFKLFKGRAY